MVIWVFFKVSNISILENILVLLVLIIQALRSQVIIIIPNEQQVEGLFIEVTERLVGAFQF